VLNLSLSSLLLDLDSGFEVFDIRVSSSTMDITQQAKMSFSGKLTERLQTLRLNNKTTKVVPGSRGGIFSPGPSGSWLSLLYHLVPGTYFFHLSLRVPVRKLTFLNSRFLRAAITNTILVHSLYKKRIQET